MRSSSSAARWRLLQVHPLGVEQKQQLKRQAINKLGTQTKTARRTAGVEKISSLCRKIDKTCNQKLRSVSCRKQNLSRWSDQSTVADGKCGVRTLASIVAVHSCAGEIVPAHIESKLRLVTNDARCHAVPLVRRTSSHDPCKKSWTQTAAEI